MRKTRKLAALSTLLVFSGCRHAAYVAPETPMPPNTILLSQMMRELSAQPGFTEAMIDQIEHGRQKGPGAADARAHRRTAQRRPRQATGTGSTASPAGRWREINPTVRVAGHVAGKDENSKRPPKLTQARTPSPRPSPHLPRPRPLRARQTRNHLPRQALRLPRSPPKASSPTSATA